MGLMWDCNFFRTLRGIKFQPCFLGYVLLVFSAPCHDKRIHVNCLGMEENRFGVWKTEYDSRRELSCIEMQMHLLHHSQCWVLVRALIVECKNEKPTLEQVSTSTVVKQLNLL